MKVMNQRRSKARPGRPKLDPGEKRVQVAFYVPPATKESYERKAERAGLSLSEWIVQELGKA